MKKWHLFIQPGRWIILRILILLLPSSFLIAQENVFHIASKKQLFIDDQNRSCKSVMNIGCIIPSTRRLPGSRKNGGVKFPIIYGK
jgi:hypothetical protein